jgi:DNA-binding HxlR family transcriptional regulator
VLILRELFQGVKRFSDLGRALNGVTQKMLTQQLRGMERDGIIHRKMYQQVPPKVEYSLTSLGKTLEPIIDAMNKWGKGYIERQRPQDFPSYKRSEPVGFPKSFAQTRP